MRYLCAVESLMRERLQADQGFVGLLTKNPQHPMWLTLRGPRLVYDLAELAEHLPGLEKYRPKRGRVDNVGLGRNVTLFDTLRHWAYRSVRDYKRAGGLEGWNAWLSACNSRALVMNVDLFAGRELHGKEVWHIAKSVAKWTWQRFDPDASDARFRELQSYRGTIGGGRPKTTTAEGNPWDAEGISRRTWYRRRESGLLIPVDNDCEQPDSGVAQKP
jgi:hypothetical protein